MNAFATPTANSPREKRVIHVDGWCSQNGIALGQHGSGGYRVVEDGAVIFEYSSDSHTNNYYELRAIAKALSFIKGTDVPVEVYTDSQTALSWISSGKVSSKCKERSVIIQMVQYCREILRAQKNIQILKWDTAAQGEIPADAGRK